jgi:S1-C subfamily serine protease
MNDNGGSGTGVVIQQDKKHAYILTAYHIIKNRNRLWGKQYINNDLQFEELTVVLEDKINDQAILESPPVWAGVANIISEDADIILYSKAFTYGFPATTSGITNGILTEARICLLHDIDLDKKETTVTSIPVSFGNSGGGLFIKKNGHFMLAGVAHCMGAMAGRFDDHYIHHISGYSTGDQLLKILGDFNNRP